MQVVRKSKKEGAITFSEAMTVAAFMAIIFVSMLVL